MDVDELLKKVGPNNQDLLIVMADFFKKEIYNPDIFHGSSMNIGDINISKVLITFLSEFKKMECALSPGHDMSHIINNMISALRIFNEYKEIGEAFSKMEKLEVILACILHDVGRYVEDDLNEINPRITLFLAPALVSLVLLNDSGLSKEFLYRILYDIASPGPKITGHRTADVTHQCDREELFGSNTVARDLAFDVGLKGGDVFFPLNEKYKHELPLPGSQEYEDFLVQMEFLMRNVYPPASPKGKRIFDEITLDNMVILMLAAHENNELFEQIFFPEINPDYSEKHWSKKKLSNEIFQVALKKAGSFVRSEKFLKKSVCPMQAIRRLLRIEGVTDTPDILENIKERVEKGSLKQRENLALVVNYVIEFTHEQRVRNLSELKIVGNNGVVEKIISTEIVEQLMAKEERYRII